MCSKHELFRDLSCCPICKLEAQHEADEQRLLDRMERWRKVSDVLYWTVAVGAVAVALGIYFFGGDYAPQ